MTACVSLLVIAIKRQPSNGKKVKKAKKKLDEVKQVAVPVPSPPPTELPKQPEETIEPAGLTEFPIAQKVGYEITRIADGTTKRIIIKKGVIAIKADRSGRIPNLLFFEWGQKKDLKWVNAEKILKVTDAKKQVSYKLVYDLLFAEPLEPNGTIEYDEDLEMVLKDSGMDQYITIAAYEGGFELTPTLKRVLIILAALGFFAGLAINGADHVVPTTIIHWVP